ncbi:MAG: hypothetical protein LBK07_08930 [Tannerella sp.]|jgi:hypothetical protein|nr:hypothetical protein [Tannerella sp.]
MKTSNIIFTVAAAYLLVGMCYNAIRLGALDKNPQDRDPYFGYVVQNVPAKTSVIILRAESFEGRSVDVRILRSEHGLFAVEDTSCARILATDSGLVISLTRNVPTIYLELPALSRVKTADHSRVSIDGFESDSLTLCVTEEASVSVQRCRIGTLQVWNDSGNVDFGSSQNDESLNSVGMADVHLRGGTISFCHRLDSLRLDADRASEIHLSGEATRAIGRI